MVYSSTIFFSMKRNSFEKEIIESTPQRIRYPPMQLNEQAKQEYKE